MGTAARVRMGSDGAPHHDGARRLRHLLRAGGRGCGGPVELSGAVCPDRVFWADAGVHDVRFFHRHACDKPERCAPGWTTLWSVVALPGATDELSGHKRSGDLRRMHGTGREQHTERSEEHTSEL